MAICACNPTQGAEAGTGKVTLAWLLYLQTHMISATVMLQMPPQLRGVSGLTTSCRLFTERKEAHWERADIPWAMVRIQLAGLRNGTINRLPEKSMSEWD